MSVDIGIDVHRKQSQVAVITGDGQGSAQPQRRDAWLHADQVA